MPRTLVPALLVSIAFTPVAIAQSEPGARNDIPVAPSPAPIDATPQAAPAVVVPTPPVATAPAVTPGEYVRSAMAAPVAERSERGSGFRLPVGDFVFRILPYVQAEYRWDEHSENELSSDGTRLLNLDRFLVRRGRLVVSVEHRWMTALMEIDASTTNGPVFSLRQAEATLRFPVAVEQPAPVALTFGMFRTPFGYETLRSARDREFMENATVTSAFFPGESDVGARVQGALGWFRYAISLVNGVPIDSPRFATQAPVAPRDFVGRVGIDTHSETVRLTAGVSGLGGSGFHPGSPQGVDGIGIRDTNESGTLQSDGLVLVQGRSQVASQAFTRFAAGLDASLHVRPVRPLWLHAYTEAIFGQNMDRALFVSDPVVTGFDVRALGLIGALTASLFEIGLVGVRVDWYQPNVDGRVMRGGRVLVSSQDVLTASFLAGVQIPGTMARLVAQFDLVRDHLALGNDGLPTDLANNRFTLRLQVSP